MRAALSLAIYVLALAGEAAAAAAATYVGQVAFGSVPVPGATVTATRDDRQVATVTDQNGEFRFADLTNGVWSIRVEMLEFVPLTRDIAIVNDAPPSMWSLALKPFDDIARTVQPATPSATPIANATLQTAAGGTTDRSQNAADCSAISQRR